MLSLRVALVAEGVTQDRGTGPGDVAGTLGMADSAIGDGFEA